MKTLLSKIMFASFALPGTQALAHHSGEASGAQSSHLVEMISAGIALFAITALVVLLFKPLK